MKYINVKEQFRSLKHEWSPLVITQLNDDQVRIDLVQGDYHWHKPHAEKPCKILLIESADTIPAGDVSEEEPH